MAKKRAEGFADRRADYTRGRAEVYHRPMAAPPSFELVVNGRTVPRRGVCLRQHDPPPVAAERTGRTGTKEGCAEGDCGACTVALVDVDATGERTYRAINTCITLLPMVAGREIVTVEGVALAASALHPVQQAMVERYGSQCGYCTPGFVVSMFEAYYRTDLEERPAPRSAIS